MHSRFSWGVVPVVVGLLACASTTSSPSSSSGGASSSSGSGVPAINCESRCETKDTSCGASAALASSQCQSLCPTATEGDLACIEGATCAALTASHGKCPGGSGTSGGTSGSSGGACVAVGQACGGAAGATCCTDAVRPTVVCGVGKCLVPNGNPCSQSIDCNSNCCSSHKCAEAPGGLGC